MHTILGVRNTPAEKSAHTRRMSVHNICKEHTVVGSARCALATYHIPYSSIVVSPKMKQCNTGTFYVCAIYLAVAKERPRILRVT